MPVICAKAAVIAICKHNIQHIIYKDMFLSAFILGHNPPCLSVKPILYPVAHTLHIFVINAHIVHFSQAKHMQHVCFITKFILVEYTLYVNSRDNINLYKVNIIPAVSRYNRIFIIKSFLTYYCISYLLLSISNIGCKNLKYTFVQVQSQFRPWTLTSLYNV